MRDVKRRGRRKGAERNTARCDGEESEGTNAILSGLVAARNGVVKCDTTESNCEYM